MHGQIHSNVIILSKASTKICPKNKQLRTTIPHKIPFLFGAQPLYSLIKLLKMRYIASLLLLSGCWFIACQATKKNTSSKELYGSWNVAFFRFHDGRIMPGALMGYPRYDFTEDGYRIKNLNEQPSPPPDSVRYTVRNDSIFYPDRPKLPPVKIIRLTPDSLVLDSEKLTWHLYKAS